MRSRTLLTPLLIVIFLTSCALKRSQVWEPRERLDVRINDTTLEKTIQAPLDRTNRSLGNFGLYYFVRTPANGKAQKTVLFCAGGPGQIVSGPSLAMSETFAEFLTQNDYNVVYFHQRGLGFSQIPASNYYDRFLRTLYVVEDVDAIRKDFLGEDGKWDAIMGWSYGTIVAQQYAHFYPANVDRLVLLGPESRDMFKTSPEALDRLSDAARVLNRETLQKIFDLNPSEFPNLTDKDKLRIVDTAFGTKETPGVYDRTEKLFGSVEWVIQFYCEPKTQAKLKESGLDRYSPEFFTQLRSLRMFGWLPESVYNEAQLGGALTIEKEVLSGGTYRCSGEYTQEPARSSRRVFDVVGVYDGINSRFLDQWIKNGKSRVREALRASEGEAHLHDLEKVGIGDNESLKAWDPADYGHNKPTLILKGSADTVSAGGQAERFYLQGSSGDRILIEFKGIGHQFGLPKIAATDKPLLTGSVRIEPTAIQSGETRAFLGRYKGRPLDQNFRFTLKANTLEPNLKVAGLGVLENNDARKTRLNEPTIVVAIQNTGNTPADGALRRWTIRNQLFRGEVQLDPPPTDPGDTREVHGTVEKSSPYDGVHIEKRDGFEEGLQVVCVTVGTHPKLPNTKFLEFWFQNTSSLAPVEGKRTEWLVSNGKFSRTFAFEPGRIEPEKIKSIPVRLPLDFVLGLKTTPIDPEIEKVERIKGCLTPKQSEDEAVYLTVKNDRPDSVDGASRKWQFENPMAKWSMNVDPFPTDGNGGGTKALATNIQLEEWKERPTLKIPAKLESGLEFRGYNVEGPNQLSVLLRNNSKIVATPAARDWIYIDPNEDGASACQKDTSVLDCLIFSFLVLEPDAFTKEHDNQIISIAKGFGAKVCYRKADDGGRPSHVKDGCP